MIVEFRNENPGWVKGNVPEAKNIMNCLLVRLAGLQLDVEHSGRRSPAFATFHRIRKISSRRFRRNAIPKATGNLRVRMSGPFYVTFFVLLRRDTN